MRFWVWIACALVLAGGTASGAEVPRAQIQTVIERCVDVLLATAQPNGSFVVDQERAKAFAVGETAFVVLSLEYARPHLAGERLVKANEAIKKGLLFIVQQPPERLTYSAGFAIAAMFKENREAYASRIAVYADMLVLSQHVEGYETGMWGYMLRTTGGPQDTRHDTGQYWGWGDRSNTQIALLGLYYAERSGYQVPKIVWQRSAANYRGTQSRDGGWGYSQKDRVEPTASLTTASTVSLYLCDEMLRARDQGQCVPPPRVKEVDAGLKWIADNWATAKIGTDLYGLYALERLGIIIGRADIGGHDWFNEGTQTLLSSTQYMSIALKPEGAAAFVLMFLSQGLEPVIINKLERSNSNDWNNDPFDIKHLVEFIQDSYQLPVQWRIVSLDAPMEVIQRAPMLFISGHKALDFSDTEKGKLKAYVAGGGTIIGEACCGKKEFDQSFRALVKELFATELHPIPTTHRIYERMKFKGESAKPALAMAIQDGAQGRPVVIYLPNDLSCQWQVGGSSSKSSLVAGSGIYFYVTVEVKRMVDEARDAAKQKAAEPAQIVVPVDPPK